MKKIFRSIIAILLCSFLFTINASAATEYKYDEKEVIESVEKMVKKLIDMNEAELEYYSENAIGWTQSACVTLLKYHENNTLGEFKNYGETELEEDGESLKITTIVRYEKADLKVITTMSYISGEIITTNVDFKVIETGSNTFGEKMLNALYNSLIGLCSVFVVLILISFIIFPVIL